MERRRSRRRFFFVGATIEEISSYEDSRNDLGGRAAARIAYGMNCETVSRDIRSVLALFAFGAPVRVMKVPYVIFGSEKFSDLSPCSAIIVRYVLPLFAGHVKCQPAE